MKEKSKKYDVALSFAGENRATVKDLADRLRKAGYKVFFDEYEKAALWGEDLSVKLNEIYGQASRFCVIFISKEYAAKPWTNYERQVALSHAFLERKAYILPVRLDDTKLPGVPETLGYLDLRSVPMSEVFELLSQKLGKPVSKSGVLVKGEVAPINQEAIRKVLAACYRRAVFTQFHAQMNHAAMFNSLAECRATLQKEIVFVEPEHLQRLVANIIGELDFIERRREPILKMSSWDEMYQNA